MAAPAEVFPDNRRQVSKRSRHSSDGFPEKTNFRSRPSRADEVLKFIAEKQPLADAGPGKFRSNLERPVMAGIRHWLRPTGCLAGWRFADPAYGARSGGMLRSDRRAPLGDVRVLRPSYTHSAFTQPEPIWCGLGLAGKVTMRVGLRAMASVVVSGSRPR